MHDEDAERMPSDLLRLDAKDLADPVGRIDNEIACPKDGLVRHNRLSIAWQTGRHGEPAQQTSQAAVEAAEAHRLRGQSPRGANSERHSGVTPTGHHTKFRHETPALQSFTVRTAH